MPTATEVVRDHREHYLVRKLARSPLLHFFPGAYRIDISALFAGIQENLPIANPRDAGVSTPSSLIQNLLGDRLDATIHNVRPATLKKLERIQKAAADSIHSTGQHTLYVGYPCVVLPVEGGRAKLAPVFLFAVQLATTAHNVTIKRVVETGDDGSKIPSDAIFNRLLAAYIDREFGVLLNATEHEMSIVRNNIQEKVNDIFDSWVNVNNSFKYPEVSGVPSSVQLKALAPEKDDPYIADYAILGLAEFSGQAMLDDLDNIITMLDDGIECPEALTSLIKAATNNSGNQPVEPSNDHSKWLVEKSDPSQEMAVWAHTANCLTVIQGPPGTGKSQTIVNIVSDALAKNKTVLVVCQKRAAIEVVQKRLAAKKLGDLGILVDDVDKDRLSVIRKIDQIDREFAIPLSISARVATSDAIQDVESQIDKAIDALNDKKEGARIRYGDIQTLLNNLSFLEPSSEWSSRLKSNVENYLDKSVDRTALETFIDKTKEIDARAKRLRYGDNLWSEVSKSLVNDMQTLADTISHTKTVSQLSKEFHDGAIKVHHNQATQWIAAHPWLQGPEVAFQAGALIPEHEGRQDFDKFKQWLSAITHIAKQNRKVQPRVLAKSLFFDGGGTEFYERLEQDSHDLRELVALREEIENHPLLNVADEELSRKRGGWAPDIHAIALHSWRRDLFIRKAEGFRHTPRISTLIARLSTSLEQKRDLDSIGILSHFCERTAARNDLKNRNLLRLRGRSGVPKTSLRQLYGKGLTELGKISPLLLVGPETAASMLPLQPGMFDIVVIDEASQMYVAEAIPMLFRAKKVVIAGDTNQMPPADFFSYSDDEDESYPEDEDIDNPNDDPLIAADGVYRLLDAAEDALSAGAPSKLRLMVHYRSARKELIDFSNHAFYEGRLIIPSGNASLPSFMQTAIEFEAVDGHFKKGLNEEEARRVVELLRNIWMEPDISRPSVGVIVANVKQRDRIVELLQELGESNDRFSRALEQESERKRDGEDASFFVRSVEHVQGDERDVIIFGLTYSGSSRSFGPLNTKNDGRKRLNVAVTRAKFGMIVLSSLNISHISNLAETGERYYVWQYLRYARAVAQNDFETKESILNHLNPERAPLNAGLDNTESPFEADVKQFIESLGYYVECQVGESGFRIDLGVRTSRTSPVYLCGVECDGARYHSGWRARTNDVWRQEILESKGWKVFRIWSTNWFDSPKETKRDLTDRLHNLRISSVSVSPPSRYQFIRRLAAMAASAQANSEGVSIRSGNPPNQENLSGSASDHDGVELGDTVIYKYLQNGKVASSRIISGQGNLVAGTINALTPLARAILGAVEGEEISFLSPSGQIKLEIQSIKKSQ